MPDDATKRRIRGFDVVAVVGLAVAVLGLLLSSVNTYYQFFHSRDSVLVFVRNVGIHVGRSVEANLVFVNNGTGQATVFDLSLKTETEDGKSEYSPGGLHWVQYDGVRRQLPVSIAPGTTKIMDVKLTLLPLDYDERLSERMVIYLLFKVANSAGRVVDSRYRFFSIDYTPEIPKIESSQYSDHPLQLFVETPAKPPGTEFRGRFH